MLLFQLFGAIVRLFIGSLTALVLLPLYVVIALVTVPVRIFSPHAHAALLFRVWTFFLKLVFLDFNRNR